MKRLKLSVPGLALVSVGVVCIGLIIGAHALKPRKTRAYSYTSSRLAGFWRDVDYGNVMYYSPIDPSLRTGTYRCCNDPSYGFGPAFRFKVVDEQPSSGKLLIREFRDFTAINAMYGLSLSNRSDTVCSISEDGQTMTQEYVYEGQRVFSVYERVESEMVP
jgi:hypothetical protein